MQIAVFVISVIFSILFSGSELMLVSGEVIADMVVLSSLFPEVK